MSHQLELLSPAGNMERLEMVLHYGADAVYLAGEEFGMRAAAGNFDSDLLPKAVQMAHDKNVDVHVTVNTIPHEGEVERLPGYLSFLQDSGVDALIVADLGVMALAKKYAPNVDLHVSTQLGVLNSETAKVLFEMGAKRVVLARETTMEEIRQIRRNIPDELEMEAFVHGAMCVSFSGRCLLSNYLTGRDANRGACAQPCRWKYHLVEEQRPGEYFEITEDGGTHIMNSHDMCMIEHLDDLIDAGISSFKIEGRMKSAYYAAAVTNAYRHALDSVKEGKRPASCWIREMEMISHRPYCTGFYYGDPGQHYAEASYFSDADVCAVVLECDTEGNAVLSQRNKFSIGDQVDLLTKDHEPYTFTVDHLEDGEGAPIESAPHATMTLRMKLPFSCEPLSLLRKMK
ncbi:MAG: U32 family peptidase [Lachnospiraceae bacterium]|nr:U32 family peptidase [Lachnospiraceae bacterium]MBQ5869605.1 U32 family peptidase [Lachnospiraceae bacterium]